MTKTSDRAPRAHRDLPVLLDRKLIRRAMDDSSDPWHAGNTVLYQLCQSRPGHRDAQAIVAKIWLIGRSYAAAIERRGVDGPPAPVGDRFYTDFVAPRIAASGIDTWLAELPETADPESAVASALQVHCRLVTLFRELTGLDKRSLASKYLHFHRPDVFLLYDERAVRATRRLRVRNARRASSSEASTDPQYSAFCQDALAIRRDIVARFGVTLTARQLDRVLLAIADRDLQQPLTS